MTRKTKGRNRLYGATQKTFCTDDHNTPTVIATPRREREGWILELTCPHCGNTHTHGGGKGLVAQGGHRVAHCRHLHGVGYFIDLEADKSESEGAA